MSSLFCPDNTQCVSIYLSHRLLSSVGMVHTEALNDVELSSVYTPFQFPGSEVLSPKSSMEMYSEIHEEVDWTGLAVNMMRVMRQTIAFC